MAQAPATPNPSARRRLNRYARAAALPVAIMSASFGAGMVVACSPCKNRCKPCAAQSACKANPCASKNPCAAKCNPCNPCAGKNPCASKNPCAAKCGPCNPCAAAPCAAKKKVKRPEDYAKFEGNPCKLMERGKELFSDKSLSGNGLSCATCHSDGAGYNATFAKSYPHQVAMGANQFGMDEVHLDEMIQICMVQPMAAEPLEWGGEDLAALVAFMEKEQEAYQEANPCAAKNPCAMKKNKCNPCNPCAANPCASANPAPKRRPAEVAAH